MPKPKPTKRKSNAGRKLYEPTPERRAVVKAMAGYGIIQDEIAAVLDIDDKTLRKHFKRELQIAAIEANAAVAQSLFQNATKHHNVAAQIFWLKTRAGWKDPLLHEITGANGEAISYVVRAPAPIESANQWLRLHAPNGQLHDVSLADTPTDD